MKKITALIPARGGSQGVPRKNIKLLKGHPLIAYSIVAAKMCPAIKSVVVSTDDDEISSIAMSYGAEILMRPDEIAQDSSTDWQVINHFFNKYDEDSVAYLRPTTPLRNPELLIQGVQFYYDNEALMSGMRSMHELPESPYKVFKINEKGYCEGFFNEYKGIKDYTNIPRQHFPKAYQPNGYLDIAKRSTVEAGESAFATKILPFLSEFVTEVDAQYEFDLLGHQLSLESNILFNYLEGRDCVGN
tara:strand:+ start:40373 stop:41107 length:735 start_codon:yes stop_codon:yes gene_type:complete